MFPSSLVHQVPEGHVGAYWRGGALLNMISEPGITNYHFSECHHGFVLLLFSI